MVGIRERRERRQHAHDGVRPVVQLEDLTHDVGVAAKIALPVVVTQHEHRRRARPILARQEGTPKQRLHAEHVEEIVGHDAVLHSLRLRTAEQDEPHRVVLRQAGEGAIAFADVGEIGNGKAQGGLARLWGGLAESNESIGLGVRKIPQQHPVDDGKDRGVRADPERQGQDDHCGVTGIPAPAAQTIAEILAQDVPEARAALLTGMAHFLGVRHGMVSATTTPVPRARVNGFAGAPGAAQADV